MAANPFLGHQYVEARLRNQLSNLLTAGAAVATTVESIKKANEVYTDITSVLGRINDFVGPQTGGGGHVTSGSGGNGKYDLSTVQPTAFNTPLRETRSGSVAAPRVTATKAPKRPRAGAVVTNRRNGATAFYSLARSTRRRKHKRRRYI